MASLTTATVNSPRTGAPLFALTWKANFSWPPGATVAVAGCTVTPTYLPSRATSKGAKPMRSSFASPAGTPRASALPRRTSTTCTAAFGNMSFVIANVASGAAPETSVVRCRITPCRTTARYISACGNGDCTSTCATSPGRYFVLSSFTPSAFVSPAIHDASPGPVTQSDASVAVASLVASEKFARTR